MSRRARMWVSTATLLGFLSSPLLFAQGNTTETIYFTGPDNEISQIDSFGACPAGPGSSQNVISDAGTNLQGIVVRGDLCILAANTTSGGGLRMYDPTQPAGAARNLGQFVAFDSAVDVDLDSSENLYAVTDDPGGADALLMVSRNATPGCTPGGYDAAGVIDSQVGGAFRLADVKFVRVSPSGAPYEAGDVLVLVRSPGSIVRYTAEAIADALASGADAAEDPLTEVDLSSVEPTGLALTQAGDFLVATDAGQVLRFGPDGASQGVFASFSGSAVDIAVGLQSGAEKAFLTVHQGGSVELYDVASGACEGSLAGANAPVGVGNASLNMKGAVFTPAGTLVTVAPTSAQRITYEQVSVGGDTTSQVFLISEGVPFPACSPTWTLAMLTLPGQPARTIPSSVRPFDRNGCPTYLVYLGSSAADFYKYTIEHHIEESALGFTRNGGASPTSCYVSNLPGAAPQPDQPRTFYATDANDPPVVEGASFTDISTGCASNIGRGGGFSMILTGWDTSAPSASAIAKLTSLDAALNGTNACAGGLAQYIASKTRNSLKTLLQDAIDAFGANDPATADAKLASFIQTAQTGSFKQCLNRSKCGSKCRNAPGELIARAASARFMVCGAAENCQQTLP